ncbi:hypothetical protein [Streptomyces sp. NRRL B-2790]|uniref:hypothetical protein n=1 Tax=Streptomyces sp. NRRL B-2790 TaxID=1463835 RepID=UPI000B28626A
MDEFDVDSEAGAVGDVPLPVSSPVLISAVFETVALVHSPLALINDCRPGR